MWRTLVWVIRRQRRVCDLKLQGVRAPYPRNHTLLSAIGRENRQYSDGGPWVVNIERRGERVATVNGGHGGGFLKVIGEGTGCAMSSTLEPPYAPFYSFSGPLRPKNTQGGILSFPFSVSSNLWQKSGRHVSAPMVHICRS